MPRYRRSRQTCKNSKNTNASTLTAKHTEPLISHPSMIFVLYTRWFQLYYAETSSHIVSCTSMWRIEKNSHPNLSYTHQSNRDILCDSQARSWKPSLPRPVCRTLNDSLRVVVLRFVSRCDALRISAENAHKRLVVITLSLTFNVCAKPRLRIQSLNDERRSRVIRGNRATRELIAGFEDSVSHQHYTGGDPWAVQKLSGWMAMLDVSLKNIVAIGSHLTTC